MANMNQTPQNSRVQIAFFGRRNVGKSSLVNAVTQQTVSIVSDQKGTTTDPVKKSMELLPIGAVTIIDTPGLDDIGELGTLRVQKTKEILEITEIAVVVAEAAVPLSHWETDICKMLEEREIPYLLVYNKIDCGIPDTIPEAAMAVSARTGFQIELLKEKIAALWKRHQPTPRCLLPSVQKTDVVLLVTPIDEAAPKQRLILPQVQAIRAILDAEASCIVTQPEQLPQMLTLLRQPPKLVITDSQAFSVVNAIVPPEIPLTSFSILYAQYHGVLKKAAKAARMLETLQDGDRILIAEGCTHHRQCNDIGTVKLPQWIRQYTGKQVEFAFASGGTFPEDLQKYRLVVHCGGCMLPSKAVGNRAKAAEMQGVAFTNYGVLIAYVHGILKRSLGIFPDLFV